MAATLDNAAVEEASVVMGVRRESVGAVRGGEISQPGREKGHLEEEGQKQSWHILVHVGLALKFGMTQRRLRDQSFGRFKVHHIPSTCLLPGFHPILTQSWGHLCFASYKLLKILHSSSAAEFLFIL